jgi:hypothetical protein
MIQKKPFARSRAAKLITAAATLLCTAALALLARPANATELAILSNGFSIRHEHRLVMGTTTRLYLGADDSNFMDVPTADITGYEKDLSIPAVEVSPANAPGPSPTTAAAATSVKSGPVKTGSAKYWSAKYGSPKSGPVKSGPPLDQVVNEASAAYHLDPDLVNSVIHAESGFNSHAVSPKGARGLMQLMPGTANQLGVADAFDPQSNVTAGSRYLRELLERYNFDLVKALAAYNAGPQRVEQYHGVPPFRETHDYVQRIVHDYNRKKDAQEKEARKNQALAKASAPAKPAPPAKARVSAKATPSGKATPSAKATPAVKPADTAIAADSPR